MNPSWTRHVPNSLTAIRFVLAFLLPFIPKDLLLATVLLALATEFLDGYTARKLDAVTAFGRLFDPVADKLFIVSSIAVLLLHGAISIPHLLLVCMRDIVVTTGTIPILIRHGRTALATLHPRQSGKVTTAFQFALLLALLAGDWPRTVMTLLYLTAVMSCISAVDYLQAGEANTPLLHVDASTDK